MPKLNFNVLRKLLGKKIFAKKVKSLFWLFYDNSQPTYQKRIWRVHGNVLTRRKLEERSHLCILPTSDENLSGLRDDVFQDCCQNCPLPVCGDVLGRKKNSFESFFTHVKPIRISDGNFILILGHKDFSMFVTNLTDVCGGRIWHKNVIFAKTVWHFFQNCSEVIWYDCQIWVQLFGKK